MTVKEAAAIMSSMGGKARAAKLTPERRREIARAAVKARWDRYRAAKAAALKSA